MDRAPAELTKGWPLADLWPELAGLGHRLPWQDDVQHARLVARLVRHAVRLDRGCIVWDGAHNNYGYGKLNMVVRGEHRQFYVHQLAWRLANGRDIQHWQEIAHSCDVPPCFNPLHLKRERRPDNRKASAESTNWKKALARAAEFADFLRAVA